MIKTENVQRPKNKEMPACNEAVLRDGGSNPAEKAVLNCKFTARSKFIGSRHLAKPLGRCPQPERTATLLDTVEKRQIIDNFKLCH
jgi:hypothetical protein